MNLYESIVNSLHESVEYKDIRADVTDDVDENQGGFLWTIYDKNNDSDYIDWFVVHKEDLGDNYNENYKKAEEMVLDYIKEHYDDYINLNK